MRWFKRKIVESSPDSSLRPGWAQYLEDCVGYYMLTLPREEVENARMDAEALDAYASTLTVILQKPVWITVVEQNSKPHD